MSKSLQVTPSEQIEQVFAGPDHEVGLGEAALVLARLEYPDLNVQAHLDQFALFTSEVKTGLPDDYEPNRIISALNGYLFEKLGFLGNQDDYYNPRNSFLNDVLERRTGIPITLSIVYLEITRRLGLPFYGVGLPGHFIIKYDDNRRAIYLDPFHAGRVVEAEDCRRLVRDITGPEFVLTEQHFRAVDNRTIILRMLSNLRSIYLQTRQYRKAIGVLDMVLNLAPAVAEDYKQRARLYHELGQSKPAIKDLETYLSIRPDASDEPQVREWITRMRRGQAALN